MAMSPEEWLASQNAANQSQPKILSPEEWLKTQQQEQPKVLGPEEWLKTQQQSKKEETTKKEEKPEILSKISDIANAPIEAFKNAAESGLAKKAISGIVSGTLGAPEGLEAIAGQNAKNAYNIPMDFVNSFLTSPSKNFSSLGTFLGLPEGTLPKPEENKEKKLIPQEFLDKRKQKLEEAIVKYKLPLFRELAQKGQDVAKNISEGMSPEDRQAIEDSQFSGNLYKDLSTGDFSDISLGKKPSVYGYALQSMEALGSMAPVILSGRFGSITGAGMAAGEAVKNTREHLEKMDDATLAKNSPYFQELLLKGYDPKDARQMTLVKASDTAAQYQGLVGALGGQFTHNLFTGKISEAIASKVKNKLLQIPAKIGLGAGEEGLEEFTEGIAADLGINKTVVREIGVDSFSNLVMGALTGGPVASISPNAAKKEEAITPPITPLITPPVIPPTPNATVTPPAPPVVSATGANIPIISLDQLNNPPKVTPALTVEQRQAAEAAAVPPEVQAEIKLRADKLIETYGIPEKDATILATQEVKEDIKNGKSIGTITGGTKPSVSVSGEGAVNTQELTTPVTAGLANNIEPVGGVGTGKEIPTNVQQGTLSTTQQVVQQTAVDYLTKLDSKVEKPNASKLKGMLNMLRIPMPETGKGFNERAIQALKKAVSPPSTTTTPTEVAPLVSPTPTIETAETSVPVAETTTPVEDVSPKVETRGRKPNPPEKKAAAAVTKAQQSKDNKQEARSTKELIERLKQNTERASQVAQMSADKKQEHRAERISLLGQLDDIANSQAKSRAAGKNAKAVLANITEEERRVLDTRRMERAKLTPEQRAAIDAKNKPEIKTETKLDSIRRRALQALGKASKSQTTNSNPNQTFNGEDITTAEQALNIVNKTGTFFERTLVRALKPFMKDVGFVVVNSKADLAGVNVNGESLESIMSEDGSTNGMMVTAKFGDTVYRTIYVRGDRYGPPNMHGINNTTVLHEALHAALDSMLDNYLLSPETTSPRVKALYDNLFLLMIRAEDAYKARKDSGEKPSLEMRALASKKGINVFQDPKEFLSYGLTDQDLIQFLLETPGAAKKGSPGFFGSLFTKFANTLRNALGMDAKHESAMQDLLLLGSGLLAEKPSTAIQEGISLSKKLSSETTIKSSKTEGIKPKVGRKTQSKEMGKILEAESSLGFGEGVDKLTTLTRSMNVISKLAKGGYLNLTVESLHAFLRIPTTDFLVETFKNEMPPIERTWESIRNMGAMKLNLLSTFQKEILKVAKFTVGEPQQMLALGRALKLARMHETSFLQFGNRNVAIGNDPQIQSLQVKLTDPNENASSIQGQLTQRINDITEAFKAWDELGKYKNGQKVYETIIDFYANARKYTRFLLDEKINALGIEPENKQKLLAYIRLTQEGPDAKIKRTTDYSPFNRHGTHWTRWNAIGGGMRLFDTLGEQAEFEEKIAKDQGTTVADLKDRMLLSSGYDIASLRMNLGSSASAEIKEMFAVIDSADVKNIDATKIAEFKENLKDELYQVYLMEQHEGSYRKQYLHAKEITGFSADVLRDFKINATRIASQISKLKHADKISSAIEDMRHSIAGNPNDVRLGLVVDEMYDRAQSLLNPKEKTFAGRVERAFSQAAFLAQMTQGATAIVQMMSVPLIVMPNLSVDYGTPKVTAAFARYGNILQYAGIAKTDSEGNITYHAPSIVLSQAVKNNPLRKWAFKEASERYGLFTQTNTAMIMENNKTPLGAYSNIGGRVAKFVVNAMPFMVSNAERLSRETTFLAVFDLEYEKTKDMEASLLRAVSKVDKLLGNYATENKPLWMKHIMGRTVGKYKMYPLVMTQYFAQEMLNMTKAVSLKNGLTRKEGREAMENMAKTLLLGSIAWYGIAGNPFFSTMCFILDTVLSMGIGDDEEDKKRRRLHNPYTSESIELRLKYDYLPDMLDEIKITDSNGKKHLLSDVLGHKPSDIVQYGALSEFSEADFTSRLSFNNMWIKDWKMGKDLSSELLNFLIAQSGATANFLSGIVKGIDDISNFQVEKGFEKITPGLFKGSLIAARYKEEGATNSQNKVIMDKKDISNLMLFNQVLGFKPTELSRQMQINYEVQSEHAKSIIRKEIAIQNFENAVNSGDDKDINKALERIIKHNERYPTPTNPDGSTKDFYIDINKVLERVVKHASELTYRGVKLGDDPAKKLYEIQMLSRGEPLPKK